MNRIASCVGLLAIAGCSWFQGPGSGAVTSGAGIVASCVLRQIEEGVSDPAAVVAACAGATLDEVVQIVESLIAFELGDAGSTARLERLRNLAALGHAKLGH